MTHDLIGKLVNNLGAKKINTTTEIDCDQIAHFMANGLHAHWMDFEVTFISEAVDLNTPLDGPEPTGIEWFRAKTPRKGLQSPDFNQGMNSVFLCAICDDDVNPCGIFGSCNNETRS